MELLEVCAIVFEAMLGAVMMWVIFRLESTRNHTAGLEDRLRHASSELISSKFAGMQKCLDDLSDRMEAGNRRFLHADERAQKMELTLKDRVHETSNWVLMNMATKDDMRRHQDDVKKDFEHVETRFLELSNAVSGLTRS